MALIHSTITTQFRAALNHGALGVQHGSLLSFPAIHTLLTDKKKPDCKTLFDLGFKLGTVGSENFYCP